MFALLRRRNFALLWFGGLISLIGDRALLTALPFYAYQETGSTLVAAGVFAAFYLPTLLLGSVAGVFADRWDRRRLMIGANILQALVLLLLLAASGSWIWLVYVVLFVEISLAMFFEPAESALLPRLVPEEDLVPANALNALNNNIARLAGPPLGGLLLAVWGLPAVALVDCASFLIAAALITAIRVAVPPEQPAPQAATTPSAFAQWWAEWRSGLGLIRRDRLIARLLIIFGLTSFSGSLFDPMIAPWVASVLRGDAQTLGWLSTAIGVGGLLGGVVVGRWGRGAAPGRLIALGNILGGSLLLVLYNLAQLPPVLGLACLVGIPLVATGAGVQTLLQTGVPDSHRGRVYGAFSATNGLVGMAALGTAGVLGELLGVVPVLSVAASLTIGAGLLALVLLPRSAAPAYQPDAATTGTDAPAARETAI